MAITIASKYPFDIPAQATALKIPPNVLKQIIQKLFGMEGWRLIPDQISFIEIAKAYAPDPVTGEATAMYAPQRTGPLIINGEDTLIIGVGPGQGTTTDTTKAYICKAAKTVFDLSPWAGQMDASLK